MAIGVRRDSNARKILDVLLAGTGIAVVSLLSPQCGAKLVRGLLKGYFRQRAFDRHRFLKDLKNLQRKELIDYRDLGQGRIKITLTRQGKKQVLQYQIDTIRLNTTGEWDRVWRLVLFDIPHSHKCGRDAFARKLVALGFYPIQKSVYLTPYPCEKEVDFVATVFDVQPYVLIMYVARFEGEEKLRHHFRLT
ncbi:MAG: hypothetical protein HY978_02390 [Candidatus Liptonbacteria bacterium]|nr:hypothetical protein [Candidatus Liptonbacteria bacterium]